MRKNYQQAELLESNAAKHPLQQFTVWLNQAISAEIPEPNAMTLATVSSSLRPSTRVVLIKGYDEQGIVWFTNYDSRKGHELAGNHLQRCNFIGWSWNAWCASKAGWKKSAKRKATPITTRVRWGHA